MTAYYNEYEPFAAEWLRRLIMLDLIPAGEVDERSILDVQPDDLRGFTQCHFFAGIGGWGYALRLAGWPDDRPVWTGSPPCQPFSAAGRRLGKDDERHLAPHFVSLVRACRPAVLFGEQVASADVFGGAAKRAGKGADAAPQWAWLDDLSDRLEAARYAVGAVDLPAAGVGAPHIRQRTFFGAVRLADAVFAGWTERGTGAGNGSSTGGGGNGWLADAQRGEWGSGGLRGLRQADGAEGAGAADEPAGDRDGCGLADTQHDDGWPDEQEWGSQGRASDARGGAVVRLADADDARSLPSPQRGLYRSQEGSGSRHGEPERSGAGVGWMADATRDRWRQGCEDAGGLRSGDCAQGTAGRPAVNDDMERVARPGTPHGGWADADWLFCRDGKWRPIEPGTFPLAHGVPGRVGRLRAYGNAIVPQAAAEVIKAFMEVTE